MKYVVVAVLAVLATTAHALFEGVEEYIKKLEEDPVEAQRARFNEHAALCLDKAWKNLTYSSLERDVASCCVKDFFMECMKTMPLLKECKEFMETRLQRFEESLASGVPCETMNLKVCPHLGDDRSGKPNKERIARFTAGSQSLSVPTTLSLVAVTLSFIAARHL